MGKSRILVLNRKILYISVSILLIFVLVIIPLLIRIIAPSVNTFTDPGSGIIVVDPGHGGIDGGTNKDGILEKDINLSIAIKLKDILEKTGYKVVMTREEDISLEHLSDEGGSRHQRDLSARVSVINNSNAQLFVSIHVNCNMKRPATDGAIVFYSDKYEQNKTLAYSIQRALNDMTVNGKKRTTHDPQKGKYFILNNAQVPGVIIETAFISNPAEKELLLKDEFHRQIAERIAQGIADYLYKPEIVAK
ncbi:MAG: N-acetylmuramoyl-L-alanine amidase [Clostridiaceae bacterium]|jgi:N-acetylmuramoyl-L-alanine amidase|nr:N-acetylmuramoyl-L-alanine amidase [Clostridiaceae bacterium]